MLDPVQNKAVGTLAASYDETVTSVTLVAGDTVKFPNPTTEGAFNVVWINWTDYSLYPWLDPNYEIVRVTGISGNNFTIIRGQDDTAPQTHNTAGKTYKLIQSITKKMIDDIRSLSGTYADMFKINEDYISGNQDAILDFNNAQAQIKWEYANANNDNFSMFSSDKRFLFEKTINSSGDFFPTAGMAWHHFYNVMFSFPTWPWPGVYKAGNVLRIAMHQQVNDIVPEFAALGIEVRASYANSLAQALGYDCNMLKFSNCNQVNTFVGYSMQMCNKVDPGTNPVAGSGFAAGALTSHMEATGGVRQHSAFLARGNAGWKNGFYYVGTDGVTVLFKADQYGNVWVSNQVQAPEVVVYFEHDASNPPDTQAVLYSQSAGGGKTKLMVKFPTGMGIQLAVEV